MRRPHASALAALLTFALGLAAAAIWLPRKMRPPVGHEASAPPAVAPGRTPESVAAPPSPIRAVDFHNFTYPTCAGTKDGVLARVKSVTLRAGNLEVGELGKGEEPVAIDLTNVSYRDLTRDGEEEAIVTLTYLFYPKGPALACTYVYRWEKGRAKQLWEGAGYLRRLAVEGGNLLVEEYSYSESDATCCPGKFVRTGYAWDGRKFETTGREVFINERRDANLIGYP
jgi:hypothetical protein